MMRIGVEVGGTFTDLVAIDENGVRVTKVPSTPKRPDEGAFNALNACGADLKKVKDLAHGSTVATNAVLERKGFKTAFVTTAGFRDILLLQRHGRDNIYDLEYQKPASIVSRDSMFEVTERILADGSIHIPLDIGEVKNVLIPKLVDGNYQAVAICFLGAYVNSAHEEKLKEILNESLPDVLVSISSNITREFREYERASTTALSAYVQPVMENYIERFVKNLDEAAFNGNFSVMQSNGGKLPASAMKSNAITALLSGPAAGVMGAVRQAARSGFKNLITLDMGGTSTDVCVVTDGKPQLTNEFKIDGLPVRIPVVDINTVGAGGGSIVWIDEGDMLRVGPQSAGAEPGPACYAKGGTQATITDAHVVCKTILPENFLGGKMSIDTDAAATAIQKIADKFGMSIEEAADSAISLSNANIVRAIQVISTERGHDPRDNVLVPFGGAGPLHAAEVAKNLGIKTIVVPPNAGVLSAYGLLASDFLQFESLTRKELLDENSPARINEIFQEMKARAVNKARERGLVGDLIIDFVIEMRFVGQAFEVPVEIPVGRIDNMNYDDIKQLFVDMHQKLFFFGSNEDKQIEYVSFRLGLTAPVGTIPQLVDTGISEVEEKTIQIFDQGKWRNATILNRAAIAKDKTIHGPAILEDSTSTLLVPQGWQAVRDEFDNLIVTLGEENE